MKLESKALQMHAHLYLFDLTQQGRILALSRYSVSGMDGFLLIGIVNVYRGDHANKQNGCRRKSLLPTPRAKQVLVVLSNSKCLCVIHWDLQTLMRLPLTKG